jgi:hypothetical protein
LAQIGVRVTEPNAPKNYLDTGDFDITMVDMGGDVFAPVMYLADTYGSKGR